MLAALAAGKIAPCLVIPTGGGKSWCMAELAEGFVEQGKQVAVVTNRRLLVEQLERMFREHGTECGIRAAGHARNANAPIQIISIQTEHSRVVKRGQWDEFAADIALIDEAHLQLNPTLNAFLAKIVDRRGRYIGFTATPVDLGDFYDHLVLAGQPSELRECGALVRAVHYGPDEPDIRRNKKMQEYLRAGKNPSEEEAAGAMMTPGLFGRVWEHFLRLNPDRRPTILFAPDVAGSLWFAERFWENGITAAHVDGAGVWWNGKEYTGKSVRDDLREASRTGELSVVCNRFVLREGVDWPWLEHGILATIFGSLPTYLQSGGRLLRASPSTGKEQAVIQDHGGNWLRHGSLNVDREWYLWGTGRMYANWRSDRIRERREKEPTVCPACQRILSQIYTGMKCECGYVFTTSRRSRPVRTSDGALVEIQGDVYVPRRITQKPDTATRWKRYYYGARSSKKGMTFSQAEANFFRELHYWPPRNLPLMPKHEADWYRHVKDVPTEDLL